MYVSVSYVFVCPCVCVFSYVVVRVPCVFVCSNSYCVNNNGGNNNGKHDLTHKELVFCTT